MPAGDERLPSEVHVPLDEEINLNGLYDALMGPIATTSHRDSRLASMSAVDTLPHAFWRRRERNLTTCTFLIRCLGVQHKADEASAAFHEMEASGVLTGAIEVGLGWTGPQDCPLPGSM